MGNPKKQKHQAQTQSTMSSTYQAQCHCGHHKWEWTLESDKQSHILCHCDTCKVLSGGPYTLNQIVPKSATHIYHHQEVMGPDTIIARTGIPADARKKFPVAAEIYGKDKLSWEPRIAETFDVLPPS